MPIKDNKYVLYNRFSRYHNQSRENGRNQAMLALALNQVNDSLHSYVPVYKQPLLHSVYNKLRRKKFYDIEEFQETSTHWDNDTRFSQWLTERIYHLCHYYSSPAMQNEKYDKQSYHRAFAIDSKNKSNVFIQSFILELAYDLCYQFNINNENKFNAYVKGNKIKILIKPIQRVVSIPLFTYNKRNHMLYMTFDAVLLLISSFVTNRIFRQMINEFFAVKDISNSTEKYSLIRYIKQILYKSYSFHRNGHYGYIEVDNLKRILDNPKTDYLKPELLTRYIGQYIADNLANKEVSFSLESARTTRTSTNRHRYKAGDIINNRNRQHPEEFNYTTGIVMNMITMKANNRKQQKLIVFGLPQMLYIANELIKNDTDSKQLAKLVHDAVNKHNDNQKKAPKSLTWLSFKSYKRHKGRETKILEYILMDILKNEMVIPYSVDYHDMTYKEINSIKNIVFNKMESIEDKQFYYNLSKILDTIDYQSRQYLNFAFKLEKLLLSISEDINQQYYNHDLYPDLETLLEIVDKELKIPSNIKEQFPLIIELYKRACHRDYMYVLNDSHLFANLQQEKNTVTDFCNIIKTDRNKNMKTMLRCYNKLQNFIFAHNKVV